MTELTQLSAAQLAQKISSREVSSVEVTEAHLKRIEQVDSQVHAFLYVDTKGALATAAEVDKAISQGSEVSPLAGVPLGLKDVIVTKGIPTTCGSKILEGWVPPYDATITTRLRLAGIPIIGKTNMDEFAMGSSTEHSAFGPSFNPWDLTRIPGGSGGGSAACVSAFEAPLAIGTDTGGSIRQPASLTGTVGVKPTYGGVSRYGLVALASSLDQAGPCARTVLDAALLHSILGGYDPKDSTSINEPIPAVVAAAKLGDIKGKRFGVIKEIGGQGFQAGVLELFNETVSLIESLGGQVVEVSCPSFPAALAAYYLIQPSEASSNLAKFDGIRFGLRLGDDGSKSVEQVISQTRAAGFGAEAIRRIILGTYALSAGYYDAYYGQAQKVRTLIKRDFETAFNKVDVLISPTSPTTAFKVGEKLNDPLAMYLNDIATIPVNLAGLPGMSLPIGLAKEDNLPVGLQIIAPAMQDDRLYNAGSAIERALIEKWGGNLLNQIPRLAGSK